MNSIITKIEQSNSLFENKWKLKKFDERNALSLSQKFELSLIAAKLAWTCAQNLGFGIRLFNTFIASVFSELYIIYYAVYRVFMGNKCM